MILRQISSFHQNKMGCLDLPIKNNPYRIIFHSCMRKPTTKFILTSSHFQVGIITSSVNPPSLQCSALTRWKLGYLASNSAISLFKLFHQYISCRSRYIFVALVWMEYQETLASSKIFILNSFTSCTHNLPWYISTHPLREGFIRFSSSLFLQFHQ